MTGEHFGARLHAAVALRGPLCVGVDPHESLLNDWGLAVSATGAREFGLRVVDAAAGRVAIIKPQVAFFERFGTEGLAALEQVLAAARAAEILVLGDAKRGDIGSTMDAYARAWLSPGSGWEVDALTVSPYLGVGALAGAMAVAGEHGKGLFVLAATSNPEASAVQAARAPDGTSVAARVIAEVSDHNRARSPGETWADIGLVIGATVDQGRLGIPETITPFAPILAPGFGFQGAQLGDIRAIFAANTPQVLPSESRSILSGGPQGLASRIVSRQRLLREATDG